MAVPNNCVPFESSRTRVPGRRKRPDASTLKDMFGPLSPAQYALLGGVLALLSEHGEDALTKSCKMVIERFGRGAAS